MRLTLSGRRNAHRARRTSVNTGQVTQTGQPTQTTYLLPAPASDTRPSDHDNTENLEEKFTAPAQVDEFSKIQSERTYDKTFDETVNQAGEAYLEYFPDVPLLPIPKVIEMSPKSKNHATMKYGFVQYNLNNGVTKGETANCYGDVFCQVHAITRVFVVDRVNHLIAMCTPQRYMTYIANQLYVPEDFRFKGNIFEFGGAAVATPRWAMRAGAWNILNGQNGQILRSGDTISITGSEIEMVRGRSKPSNVLVCNVPFSGVSWFVMEKWMAQAPAHKISIVSLKTGLDTFTGKYDSDKTLPLVIREDEADMLMGDVVYALTYEDDRFHVLRDRGEVTEETKAMQFRGGWYAPSRQSGVTRIMRLLKFDQNQDAKKEKDGSGPFKKVESAYSDKFVHPPSHELWLIGGVEDVHSDAAAMDLGTHLEMQGVDLMVCSDDVHSVQSKPFLTSGFALDYSCGK